MSEPVETSQTSLGALHPAVRRWFERDVGMPSPPQADGWPAILGGGHTLIAAPTGSGKTLAAFLCAIDALVREGQTGELPDETRVLYVSPLKALGNDIEKNLQAPLTGIARELATLGLPAVPIRTLVRTGDTPARDRAGMRKRPPHILVTTPESLYVLLTSESGRRALATVRTLIVDEIHALVGDRRGAHLALSIARLAALVNRPMQRIGLSATQTPIGEVAKFLVGSTEDGAADISCNIIDHGHRRDLRVEIELPGSALEAVMPNEVWSELYDRLAALITARRTTLVFVNTRRLSERVAKNLAERLGETLVTSHHGSLSREHRLRAETRLKAGELKALVATGSLELGIDIGSVDLVCQVGSTRSIASFLQRVGRSGHRAGAFSEGRLFPLTRDELVESVALVSALRRGELDRVCIARPGLDVLSQQLVAAVAAEGEWDEAALFALVRRAYPYRELERKDFDAVVSMLAEGFVTVRGRRGALLHHDRVNGRLRPRKNARITAITCGGAIPDNADYQVVLSPSGAVVGSINEDFAIESMAGDIFQLGNSAWRILRVEPGTVRVEDAHGAPPTIPFWLGEAPGRSAALSRGVSEVRERVDAALRTAESLGQAPVAAAHTALVAHGASVEAAEQLAEYLGAAQAALGQLPTHEVLVAERFFDEAGGMQLVIHSTYGSRLNRAFGLALRKRFCRAFNFELQAAATEDAIILSLGPTHSFPLAEIRDFLHAKSVRDVLVQALLDAPMFETRFRWNATRSLAVKRWEGGRKTPARLLRMRTNDLAALVFPDQQACLENIQGEREIPDHPLVRQTIEDCLHDAMDIEALEQLLERLDRDEVAFVFRDLTEPSPLANEILGARPYAFLDDAPLEERRTQAVMARRFMDRAHAETLATLDPAAIERVVREAWPEPRDRDELHDALVTLGCMTEREVHDAVATHAPEAAAWLTALTGERRATRVQLSTGHTLICAAERLAELIALHPEASLHPAIATPPARDGNAVQHTRHDALVALVQARVDALGPVTDEQVALGLGISASDALAALHVLESRGHVLRGHFRQLASDDSTPRDEFCERGLLARIHRFTLDRLRREIEPVSPQVFMRFLFAHQHVKRSEAVRGRDGLYAVIDQLTGFEAKSGAWESEVLAARVRDYDPSWLDELCLSGRVRWARLSPPGQDGVRGGPLRSAPLALCTAAGFSAFRSIATGSSVAPSRGAERVRAYLAEHGASFFSDIEGSVGLLPSVLEDALAELVAAGLAASDAFSGLRALLVPASKRSGHPRRPSRAARHGATLAHAGRWSLVKTPALDRDHALETIARTLLRRYGVVFRKLLEREHGAVMPPWRELSKVFRKLEARGEIRGGRFVDGFSGEQFAMPDAIASLRRARHENDTTLISLCASDPLNLVGGVLPGERIPTLPTTRIVFQDGVVVGVREAGQTRLVGELAPEVATRVRTLLVKPERLAQLGDGDDPPASCRDGTGL